MGAFLNEFDANLRMAIVVFIVGAAPTFGYFFNQLIDRLPKGEHLSLYVSIGVTVTLAFGALLSWKASLLLLSIFCLTGLPMIVGEYLRTAREQKRRKISSRSRRIRLPYAANGLITEATQASELAHTLLTKAINASETDAMYKHMVAAALQLVTITNKLAEVKQIQMEK